LPESQRESLAGRRQRLRIDLRRKDNDQIALPVEAAINRALSQRRLLRFAYHSPAQADGRPRTHTVQPWHLHFDSMRGHLYLDAFCLEVSGPHGVWQRRQWQLYRLGRILAEGIEVLPDRLPPTPPKRPRHPLEYWLAPEIARLGEVTRHFEGTEVHETNEAGWVRVTATTHDLFWAVRQLLRYGPHCQVTGGVEALREMRALVGAMQRLYFGEEETA
jgi:predicted DNA-binding transcriptional regulator YafY